MTARTRTVLNSNADTNFADNATGNITPALLKAAVKDQADSAIMPEDQPFKMQASDASGQLAATAQPWFPTAGAVSVLGSTLYEIEGNLLLNTGATTHTTGINFTGTATVTSFDIMADIWSAAVQNTLTTTAPTTSNFFGTTSPSSNFVLNATSTAAWTQIRIHGMILINAAGTLIPNFQFSANPTTLVTVKRGSWLALYARTNPTGTWA